MTPGVMALLKQEKEKILTIVRIKSREQEIVNFSNIIVDIL